MQYSNLLFLAFMAVVFWFLVIRPQQQRTRRQAEMVSTLAPGDEVLTVGGIYGVVVSTGERIRLAVAQGEIEVVREAISRVTASGEAPPESVGGNAVPEAGDGHEAADTGEGGDVSA